MVGEKRKGIFLWGGKSRPLNKANENHPETGRGKEAKTSEKKTADHAKKKNSKARLTGLGKKITN